MISILIFILVIAFLIFIHELGHFLAAKLFNIRVDEFAIGFPPTLASFKKGETTYKLNSIPFGGYVKIHGQDGESAADARSFSHSAWWKKIIVLSAGVLFNLIGAWLLFTLMFAIPHMQSIEPHRIDAFANTETVVVLLQENGPAFNSGMEIGDRIISVNNENINHSHQLAEMVFNDDISVLIDREGQEFEFILSHEDEADDMYFTYSSFGLLAHTQGFGSYGIRSIAEGFHQTIFVTEMIFTALRDLIVDLFTGQAETENLAGPVGIVSIVGEARTAGGFIALLQLTAFLSINLALLNIIPFPALDGGRIMVVLVELIARRPIPQKALMWINGLGFLSLILLMIAVTVQDVIKLF